MPGTEIIKIVKILEDKVILEVSERIPLKCDYLESKENGKKNIILNIGEMIHGRTNVIPVDAGFYYKAKLLYTRKVKNRYIY